VNPGGGGQGFPQPAFPARIAAGEEGELAGRGRTEAIYSDGDFFYRRGEPEIVYNSFQVKVQAPGILGPGKTAPNGEALILKVQAQEEALPYDPLFFQP